MQHSDSRAERVDSEEAEEIVEGAHWALICANVFIAHHALASEYVFGFVFVQKASSDFFESVVFGVVGKVSSTGGCGATYCGV